MKKLVFTAIFAMGALFAVTMTTPASAQNENGACCGQPEYCAPAPCDTVPCTPVPCDTVPCAPVC